MKGLLQTALCLLWAGPLYAASGSPLSLSATSVHGAEYAPANAMDANPNTRWASKANGKADITIDFGRAIKASQMSIKWEAAYAVEYEIQTSSDKTVWNTIHHQKQGKGDTEIIAGLDITTRYLRIHCVKPSKHNLFSIWEVTVNDPALIAALEKARRTLPPENPDPGKKRLADFGVKDVIFAVRADGNDGHWYANLGYWSYDDKKMLYGKGGKLCKFNIETAEMTVLIDDPEGTIRDPALHYDAEKILFFMAQGKQPSLPSV